MILRTLQIENFRGIEALTIELDRITILIGENNTGKTSVLEALHTCMNRGLDETNKQLVGETRTPIPARPGKPRRIDYEYERRGTADVFLFTEPLGNWRCVDITERRTRVDWALQVKNLVDDYYPHATKIRLVMDNLNTHTIRHDAVVPYGPVAVDICSSSTAASGQRLAGGEPGAFAAS